MIRVLEFPDMSVSGQLFYAPGAAVEGGFTSGGARIVSPEPGGFSALEIQPSLQIRETTTPFSSWIMSKINGQVFRVRMAFTPQIISTLNIKRPTGGTFATVGQRYNVVPKRQAIVSRFIGSALPGTNIIRIDMSDFGPILGLGHVIGHAYDAYMIDEIFYDSGMVATIVVNPPFRRQIKAGDQVLFRPWFTGSIANGGEIRKTYDASDNGNIQMGRIVFNEAIIP